MTLVRGAVDAAERLGRPRRPGILAIGNAAFNALGPARHRPGVSREGPG